MTTTARPKEQALPFDVVIGLPKPHAVNPHIFWPKDAAFEDNAEPGGKELKE